MKDAPELWDRFRERLIAGDLLSVYARHFCHIRDLLDLPIEAARQKLRETVLCMDTDDFVMFHDAMILVSARMGKLAGLTAEPEAYMARVAELDKLASRSVFGEKKNEADVAFAQRMLKMLRLRQDLDELRKIEAVTDARISDVPPGEFDALSQACSACAEKLESAVKQSGPGQSSPVNIEALKSIISELEAWREKTHQENPARKLLNELTVEATEWVGHNYAVQGHPGQAKEWLQKAVHAYAALGDNVRAQEVKQRLQELDVKQTANVDQIVTRHLRGLLYVSNKEDPFAKARHFAELSAQAIHVGDLFEVDRLVTQTANALQDLGFEDPEGKPLNEFFSQWIEAIPREYQGNDFLEALNVVVQLYSQVEGGRTICRSSREPQQATRSRTTLEQLSKLQSGMRSQAKMANEQVRRRLEQCASDIMPGGAALAQFMGGMPGEQKERGQDLIELDHRIEALVAESARREEAGEDQENLLKEADALHAAANATYLPIYSAKALGAKADVLLALKRIHDAVTALETAHNALTSTPSGNVSGFAAAAERTLSVQILRKIAYCYMLAEDAQGISETCERGIREIEHDRYKVTSPYQQSAFLRVRGDLYTWGVGAAYNLGNYALMLERAELSKARGVLRYRGQPAPPDTEEVDLERQFSEVNREIDSNHAGEDQKPPDELLARRRQLWDLLAIRRYGARSSLPEFRLNAVHSLLEEDEVILYYYFVAPGVLLTTAIDRQEIWVERVILQPGQVMLLRNLIEAIESMTGSNNGLDGAIQKLSSVLLPDSLHPAFEDKQRLIFSPHRLLHLFPFHAMTWAGDFLIRKFAVSYIPNLSSMLLEAQAPIEQRLLAIGINKFHVPGTSLGPLPDAEHEVDQISSIYTRCGVPVETLKGSQAIKNELLLRNRNRDLEKVSCLHLATHGRSVFEKEVSDTPMESRLYLEHETLDGLEISRLRLGADVVVLSACDSGQRAISGREMPELPGDEMFGLQAAFFMAGARCVLGSLWPVNSEAARQIMTSLHQHLANGDEVEFALQRAMLEYLDHSEWRQVYYWAPFFLSILGRRSKQAHHV